MNNKLLVLGSLLVLVLFFGCLNLKESVELPVVGESLEKEEFSKTITVSDNEYIELSALYAKITVDNVQIKELIHYASFDGAVLNSEIVFLTHTWSIISLDCTNKEVTLESPETSLTLEDGSTIAGLWKVNLACENDTLSLITLDLTRAKVATAGDGLSIPDSSGYVLLYNGDKNFSIQ